LHETDLSNRADSIRIVCAFDLRHRVSHFRRKAPLLGFLSDEPHMREPTDRMWLW
jgi:hypothetical protein